MDADTRPAAIYCRISDDPEGRRVGVDRQEKACRLLAHQRGWSQVEVYVDNDVSAFSGVIRPAYRRLLEDLQLGRICAVLTWDSDRLHRSTRELEDFIDLVDAAEVPVLTVTAGDANFDTATGRMQARIMGTVSRYESEHKTERTAAGMASIAKAGRWKGGRRPYGYDIARDNHGRPLNDGRLLVLPQEAAVVREAAARVLAGESAYKVVIDFNRRGIPSTHGVRWRPGTLRRILTNPTTAGKREHHGTIVAEAQWPALIDLDDWYGLRQKLLPSPGRPAKPRSAPNQYLLSRGVAVCGACGRNLVGNINDRKKCNYLCPSNIESGGCGKVSCSAPKTDRLVVEALMRRHANDDRPEGRRVATDDHARGCVLDAVADLLVGQRVTASVWQVLLAGVAALSDDPTRPSDVPDPLGDALFAAFERVPFDMRRQRVAEDITKVIVHPTRIRGRFDPSRVEIVWAG